MLFAFGVFRNALNERELTVREFNCCLTHSEKDDVVKSSETNWWCGWICARNRRIMIYGGSFGYGAHGVWIGDEKNWQHSPHGSSQKSEKRPRRHLEL